MTDIAERLERLRERRTDPRSGRLVVAEARSFEKLAKALPESTEAARAYLEESALPVEAVYTQRSYAAARHVRSVIDASLDDQTSVEYEYQGSVTNNTHIRIHSDIDLLVLTTDFVSLESPLKATSPFKGDVIETLLQLREHCEEALALDLELDVNATGSKALAVDGANLECKVDIVPANWLDTVAFRSTKNKIHRAVQVVDAAQRTRITNYPFLYNQRIQDRDDALGGMLRRAIRVLKSIRADSSEQMRISSFDIAGLCYRMPDELWPDTRDATKLVLGFLQFVARILKNDALYSSLRVPTDQRLIFGPGGTDRDSLVQLAAQAHQLYTSCKD